MDAIIDRRRRENKQITETNGSCPSVLAEHKQLLRTNESEFHHRAEAMNPDGGEVTFSRSAISTGFEGDREAAPRLERGDVSCASFWRVLSHKKVGVD